MTIEYAVVTTLRHAPLNVRKVKPAAIEALADDIFAHDLIQNLTAYRQGKYLMICAGGRRLSSLQMLLDQKRIGDDYLVPVDVRPKAQAIEISLAENAQREDMHPADLARGFSEMRDASGYSADDIAVRFGFSVAHVTKLLRLGSLPPEILEAFGEDKISIKAAEALTITEDSELQIATWQRFGDSEWQIRRALTDEKLDTNSKLFRFVGLTTYQDAGGTITPDLFSEDGEGYADDAALVHELAQQKLDDIAERYRQEGWVTVTVQIDQPKNHWSNPLIHPSSRKPNEEEAALVTVLEGRLEALQDEDEDSDELQTLSAQYDALRASFESFTPEQRENGAVSAYLDYDGELDVRYCSLSAKSKNGSKSGQPNLYSAALVEELTSIRVLALQQSVAAQPSVAIDILLDILLGQMSGNYYTSKASEISGRCSSFTVSDDLLTGTDIGKLHEEFISGYGDIVPDDRFATIQAMPESDKMNLLAVLVALTLTGKIAKGCSAGAEQHIAETYAQAAGLNIAEMWTPTQPFFDKVSKAGLLKILEAECGIEAANNCSKMKRSDLAVTVASRLPAGWLPEPIKALAPLPSQLSDEGEKSKVA